MAKVTIVFGVLLIVLGLVGYFGTGSAHPTALIPTWFGLALGVGGFLAISPSEGRRKLFMHINVTIGLLGFIGAACFEPCTATGTRGRTASIPTTLRLPPSSPWPCCCSSTCILCVRSFIQRAARGRYNAWADFAAVEWEWACAPSARRTGAARAPARPSCPNPSRT